MVTSASPSSFHAEVTPAEAGATAVARSDQVGSLLRLGLSLIGTVAGASLSGEQFDRLCERVAVFLALVQSGVGADQPVEAVGRGLHGDLLGCPAAGILCFQVASAGLELVGVQRMVSDGGEQVAGLLGHPAFLVHRQEHHGRDSVAVVIHAGSGSVLVAGQRDRDSPAFDDAGFLVSHPRLEAVVDRCQHTVGEPCPLADAVVDHAVHAVGQEELAGLGVPEPVDGRRGFIDPVGFVAGNVASRCGVGRCHWFVSLLLLGMTVDTIRRRVRVRTTLPYFTGMNSVMVAAVDGGRGTSGESNRCSKSSLGSAKVSARVAGSISVPFRLVPNAMSTMTGLRHGMVDRGQTLGTLWARVTQRALVETRAYLRHWSAGRGSAPPASLPQPTEGVPDEGRCRSLNTARPRVPGRPSTTTQRLTDVTATSPDGTAHRPPKPLDHATAM